MFAVGAMAERAANVGDFEESFAIIQSLPPEDAVNPRSSIKGTSKLLALLFYMQFISLSIQKKPQL